MVRKKNLQNIVPNAFTLLELLVVICIISMLTAILLPLLGRAREAGKSAHCLSNLKQLTLAWNMYGSDNDGRMCSPETLLNDEPWKNHWVCDGPAVPYQDNPMGGTEKAIKDGVLWPYLETLKVYKCRSDSSGRFRSYSISRNMGGARSKGYRLLSQVEEVSEKMVFIDATSNFSGLILAARLMNPPKSYRHTWLVGAFSPREMSITNDITLRHSGGCNLSFADNHCESWKWEKPGTKDGETGYSAKDMERLIKVFDVGILYE